MASSKEVCGRQTHQEELLADSGNQKPPQRHKTNMALRTSGNQVGSLWGSWDSSSPGSWSVTWDPEMEGLVSALGSLLLSPQKLTQCPPA